MHKIRSNVFETNSSSCHSLIINDNTEYDTIGNDGVIILDGGEFGWGYEELRHSINKANYVAVLLECLKDNFEGAYDRALRNWSQNHYSTCLNNFEAVIKEQTGASQIVYNFSTDWNNENYSYIDHQSAECISDFEFMLSPEKIRELVFGKNSYIIITNDNV